MEWPTIAFYRRRAQRALRSQCLGSPERLEVRSLLAAIVPTALPNDPSFAQQWALHNLGQYGGVPGNDVRAPAAWNTATGSRSVVVAVIDSGIDLTHPDLAANVWTNPGEIASNGVDDDHNGFVDDVHGWNFIDNNADVTDGFGHGTHVAGIIGAVGNNGVGVAGIAWQVSLMVLRVQNNLGAGSTSAVIGALNYATMMRRDHGINVVVTNNSWESYGGLSALMQEAIRAQGDAGITFVAAAGNHATDNDVIPRYPSTYDLPNVISVAALDPSGNLAGMSDYGVRTVDLAAPGTLIQSTWLHGSYGMLSGTSMAAPQVSGAVALLAAAKPGITAAQVRAAILGTTTPVASLAGRTATGGRLNVAAALASLGGSTSPAPVPIIVPPVVVTTDGLPFADAFSTPDGPLASVRWVRQAGRFSVASGGAVSRAAGVSLATARGVAAANVSLQAKVTVARGGSIGLVARHSGPGDRSMYLGQIVRTTTGYVARIVRNVGGVWKVLASRAFKGGVGTVQFNVVGSHLSLAFNGLTLLSTRDVTITAAGGAGMRAGGVGTRIDSFTAARI